MSTTLAVFSWHVGSVHKEQQAGMPRPIVLSVVSGWSMKNYLASEIAQGYFRAIIGRYSKDVMHKQLKVRKEVASIYDESAEEQNARIQEEACLETVIDVHDSSCRRDFQG
jgi:hypothetical protein